MAQGLESGTPPADAVRESRMMRLAALLARHRNVLTCAAWIASTLAIATLVRLAAGVLTSGVPLVFYLPAVVIVALFTGWECGVVAIVLATLLAWFLFVPPAFSWHPPTYEQGLTLLIWAIVAGSQVAIAHFLRVTLQRVLHSETRYRKLLSVASGLLCVANTRLEFETLQPGWTELTGIAWPDYSGRGWLESVHPEDHLHFAPETVSPDENFREAEFRLWNHPAGDWRWYQARLISVPRPRGDGTEIIASLHDIHDHKLTSEQRELMLGESRHRLKNLFTVIEALAKSSRDRSQPAVEEFLNRFLGRMRAIATASDILLTKQRHNIECNALVRETLGPFMEGRDARFAVSGPDLLLPEETGATLGLAIHEMATNALKYGALSGDRGSVSVAWSAEARADGQELVSFEWRERGGPSPTAPDKEGFGMRLIRSVPARERSGEVMIEYPPEGFSCRIAFLRASIPRNNTPRPAAAE